MDPKGRAYATTAADRAKKNPSRAKAPPLTFSSDSEDSDFVPSWQNKGRYPGVVQKSPIRVSTPKIDHRQHSLVQKSTEIDIDFERCDACKEPFGYEEVMTCSYCCENFCCRCAKVPPIVATVQFQVPNLRWYCLPCDKHQSTIIRNFKEGIVEYQTPKTTTSTPQGKVAKHAQNDTPSDEIVRIMADFANRMDSQELLIGELKAMILSNQSTQGEVSTNVPASAPPPQTGSQTASSQRVQQIAKQTNKSVTFSGVVQASGSAQKQAKPSQHAPVASRRIASKTSRNDPIPVANATVREIGPPETNTAAITAHETNHPAPQRRRLTLTPVAVNSEIEEKERRKNNIIMHNLPEQTAEDKQKADLEEVNFILSEAMLLPETKAVTTRRLGAPRSEGRPRSLLVILNTERSQVLKKSGSIRQYLEWETVFIDPDRTLKERQLHTTLRSELQSRKRKGETDLVIRNGEIVHRRAVPLEIPIEDLTAPSNPTQQTDQEEAGEDITQEEPEPSARTEEPPPSVQPAEEVPDEVQPSENDQSNKIRPSQDTQSVSDNTLGELEVPEIMRHESEEEESVHNTSCAIH